MWPYRNIIKKNSILVVISILSHQTRKCEQRRNTIRLVIAEYLLNNHRTLSMEKANLDFI